MKNTTYTKLQNSMDRKERDEGKDDYYSYIALGEDEKELKDFLVNLVYSDDGIATGDNNTNYDVLYDAVSYLSDFTLEEFKGLDIIDAIQSNMSDGFCSVYTMERLAILNMHNEDSIKEIMEDYEVSISEACAAFYDESVQDTLIQLQNYTNK